MAIEWKEKQKKRIAGYYTGVGTPLVTGDRLE